MNGVLKGVAFCAAGAGGVALSAYLKTTGAMTSQSGTIACAGAAVAGVVSLVAGLSIVGRMF